jgi:hypothetical protein
MDAMELTEKVQDGVVKVVETSQNWTLGALRSTSSTFDTFRPDTSLIPFADKVPTPAETIDSAFNFVDRLLLAQRAFVSSLVEVTAPKPTVKVTAKKV